MTPIGRNGEPTYKRIQNVIRRRIEGGQLKPGDMVASERELAKTHKVSLMTARHALADLAREGMVERRHGSGTFVAPPKIHFNKLMSYTEQMASRGLAVRSKNYFLGRAGQRARNRGAAFAAVHEPFVHAGTRAAGCR